MHKMCPEPPDTEKKKYIEFANGDLTNSEPEIVGSLNTRNITGPEDRYTVRYIFRYLLEWQASQDYMSNGHYLKHVSHVTQQGRVLTDVSVDNGIVHGSCGQTRISSWHEAIQNTYTVNELIASLILSNVCQMHPKNLLHFTSRQRVCESTMGGVVLSYVPDVLKTPDGAFYLFKQIQLNGHSGQCIGSFLWYRSEVGSFCLFAPVVCGKVCLAKAKPTAHFYNEDKFNKYPNAIIILCQDSRTAMLLEEKLQRVAGYSPDKIIVTAHLGTELNLFSWDYFYARHVVFIPAPEVSCLARVKIYVSFIKGADARSFLVYLGFVLPEKPKSGTTCSVFHFTVHYCEDIDQPLHFVEMVIREAVSFDQYVVMGKNSGIFQKAKQENAVSQAPATQQRLPISSDRLPSSAYDLKSLCWDHVFRLGTNVCVLGRKGCAKTTFIWALVTDLFVSPTILGIMQNSVYGHSDKNKVLVVDPETPEDERDENLERHGLKDAVGKRLFIIASYAEKQLEWCSSFDLNDENFRKGLLDYALSHSCRYIILDGLIPLLGNQVPDRESSKILANWIQQCEKCGICVIWMHHTPDNNLDSNMKKGRGNQVINVHSRTEIVFVSKNEILRGAACPDEVKELAENDGLTLGLHFKSCKTAPVLAGKTFWYHVPLWETKWELLCATNASNRPVELPFRASNASNDSDQMPSASAPVICSDGVPVSEGETIVAENSCDDCPSNAEELDYDEEDWLDHIKKHGPITREQCQLHFNKNSDRQAHRILNKLINLGKIMRLSKGPKTEYRANV